MEDWSTLKFAFIVHREMGCADESSTDEEQAEKILFSYPREMSLYNQLSKINMLEGLIEFSSKFSSEVIDSVIMDCNTWSFFECEENIWIIVAVDNGDSSGSKHRPSSCGMRASLLHLYDSFTAFHGCFTTTLGGSNGCGWVNLACIQSVRKNIRKLGLSRRQQIQDLDTFLSREHANNSETEVNLAGNTDEHVGIRSTATTKLQIELDIAAIDAELVVKNQKLTEMLSDQTFYIPQQVRETLQRFMHFYLSTAPAGLLQTPPSLFSGLQGTTLLSLSTSTASSGSTMSSSLLSRIRRTVELALTPLFAGSLLLHEGQVLWSDLDSALTLRVAEFVSRQDLHALRRKATTLLEVCGGDSARSKSNKFQVTDSEIEGFISQRLADVLDGRQGVVTQGWETLDLSEDVLVNSLLKWGSNVGGAGDGDLTATAGRAAASHCTGGLPPLDNADVLCGQCHEVNKIYCPSVYVAGACIGRMVFYRQNRFVVAVLIPPTAGDGVSESKHYLSDHASKTFLNRPQQPNDKTFSDKKNQITISQFLEQLRSIASASSGGGGLDAGSKLCNRTVTSNAVSGASVLALCAVLQLSVSSDLNKVERTLKVSITNKQQAGRLPLYFASTAESSSNGSGRSSSPVPGGGGSNSIASSTAPPSSSSSSSVISRDVKVIYFNSASGTLKMSDVCKDESSPLGELGAEVRSLVLSELQQRDPYKNKVIGLVSDRLRDEMESARCPPSSRALLGGLDAAVLRALNDIWVELAGRELSSRETGGGGARSPAATSVVEACLRVSTAHRGGVWVTGRKIGCDRYLYMVVDRCATLNDMYEVFEDLCEQLQMRCLML